MAFYARPVTLAWDTVSCTNANGTPYLYTNAQGTVYFACTNVVSYNVYWGPASGMFTNHLNVLVPETAVTITNLIPGGLYFFVATAVYEFVQIEESGWSNEISYQVPPLPCVSGFRVVY